MHKGHLELAQAAAEACGLDEVWLLVNPHAAGDLTAPSHKSGAATFGHRVMMAKLAVDGLPGASVYLGPGHELPHNMTSFRQIMQTAESNDFVFIAGMDVMAQLDKWDEVETVVENAAFVVAHRPGTGAEAVDGLRERLGALGGRLRAELFEFEGHNAVSSSQVRADLRAGERPATLDERVLEYIELNGLYR